MIHELIENSIKQLNIPIKNCDIIIHHYGYLNRSKEKDEKYLKLGRDKLKNSADDEKSLYELAEQFLALNNYDESLIVWRRLLQIDPTNYMYAAKMGTTYNLLQDFDNAEKLFKKSLEISENEYSYKHLGICYAGKKDFKKAYEMFKCIVYTANDLKIMGDFACCCNYIGKYDEAITILEKALKINEKLVLSWGLLEIAYNKKGLELMRKNEYKKAIRLFKSALKLDPHFREAELNIRRMNSLMLNK